MNIEWLLVVVTLGLLLVISGLLIKFGHEEDWEAAVAGVLLIVLLFLLVNAGAMSVARRSCRVIGELNGWDQQYSFTNKCLLEVEPGRWIPKSAVYSQVEDLPG